MENIEVRYGGEIYLHFEIHVDSEGYHGFYELIKGPSLNHSVGNWKVSKKNYDDVYVLTVDKRRKEVILPIDEKNLLLKICLEICNFFIEK